MDGVSPETCRAIKKNLNNKFYYIVASCWFFLRDLYYDARIHGHQGYGDYDLKKKTIYTWGVKLVVLRLAYSQNSHNVDM